MNTRPPPQQDGKRKTIPELVEEEQQNLLLDELAGVLEVWTRWPSPGMIGQLAANDG